MKALILKEDLSMAKVGFSEYQKLAAGTANQRETYTNKLLNWTMGLSTETGEIAEVVKHWAFHNHPLDTEHIKEELGDLLWYISQMSELLGFDLQDIADENLIKLAQRYPYGFDSERSINREEE